MVRKDPAMCENTVFGVRAAVDVTGRAVLGGWFSVHSSGETESSEVIVRRGGGRRAALSVDLLLL